MLVVVAAVVILVLILEQSMATVREVQVSLLTTLLKAKQAREPVLQWIAAVCNHNRQESWRGGEGKG